MLGPSPPDSPPRLEPPGWLAVLAAGFLPGALAGTHLAGLIFFLNPGLDFAAVPLARGVLLYGGLGGVVTLLLSLPWLWGRPVRANRWLPWGLTAALTFAAVLDGTHAYLYGYYLPPGINLRLLKAGALLGLAALVAFYTALLHSVAHRRYGPRSRVAYLALALLSIYVMVERREAFHPRPPASPRPSAVEDVNRPTLLVVGLEGATLDAILPLASQGRLPFLASVVEQGAYGRLASLAPNRRLPLWTTLATGKYPYKNGLVSDRLHPLPALGRGVRLELLPRGIGFDRWGTFRPGVASDGRLRRTRAIWEVLPRLGIDCGVIAWPGSFPVRAGPTFFLSDRYFAAPALPATVHPAELAARSRLFRVRGDEIDPLLLASLGEPVPAPVVRGLAGDLWRESLASLLLGQYRHVGALFIELDGLAEVSRAYLGGYAAAQFEGAQSEPYQRASRLVAAYYAHLDLFLSRLWDRTPPPKLLVVVSPYGAEPAHGWRRVWRELTPGAALAAGFSGSPDGALLLYGEGVRPGTLVTNAHLVDLVPTVAYGMGLPIARDLDGQVLTGAYGRPFLAQHPLTFLPSYETLPEP